LGAFLFVGLCSFFAFRGACGFGGVFSIRFRTSSREGTFGMPQPLSRILGPNKKPRFKAELPNNPELCTQALDVVSRWTMIEREMGAAIATLAPRKGSAIAELVKSAPTDSVRFATYRAIASLTLNPVEEQIFQRLMKEYEICYSLRNPLAHWTLGSCKELPDAIIAMDPKMFVKLSGDQEDVLDATLGDLLNPEKRHLESAERLSDETVEAINKAADAHAEHLYAYRTQDFKGMETQMDKLRFHINLLRYAVRLRHLKIGDGYSLTLQRLLRDLGLPEPKEDSA
jgi:hypothetical protein